MFNKEINQKFLTIEKKDFNFHTQKLVNKIFKFYTKNFFPPTIWYTSPQGIFETPEIKKTLNFEQKQLSIETQEKFKENIAIQSEVLNIIKQRNEKYKYRCGLIKLTTGKGKSHVIMDLVGYYQTNSLILVHNIKTLNEMAQKFSEFTNITPCKYGGGKKQIGPITIMTKKSFTNLLGVGIEDKIEELKKTKVLESTISTEFVIEYDDYGNRVKVEVQRKLWKKNNIIDKNKNPYDCFSFRYNSIMQELLLKKQEQEEELKKFKEKFCFQLIVCDEAPIGFSKNFYHAMNIFTHGNTTAFYGLSGTPESLDFNCEDLQKYFGKIIEPSSDEYNIIPNFEMIDFQTNNFYEFENSSEMRQALTDDKERLEEQVKFILTQAKKSNCLLILTDRVEETQNLFEKLAHIEDFFVFTMTGSTDEKTDFQNVENAKNCGKKVIIIGTIQKVGVGVDIPMIDSVFLASAIKFRSTVIQAIGRALRKYKNKENVSCIIWNDIPIYKKQRSEKFKAIKEEYGVEEKEIKIHKIKLERNHFIPLI